MDYLKKVVADTFLELAGALETGSFGKSVRIAVTGLGSEHGEDNVLRAAASAACKGITPVYIGTKEAPGVTTIKVNGEEEGHKIMADLLASGGADAAVTMHYPFPIGVSTVGRVVTPARGRQVYIATTTGTSSPDRVEGMIKNAVYGIIAAKACGIENPSVGVLNLDGAVQTEAALRKLRDNGYSINLVHSARAEGGALMRGNDLLLGTADVCVCDPLTGNILVKMLAAGLSGGDYEVSGYGYGPGIGESYDKLVMIVSRASGSPVIEAAIEYAAQLVRGRIGEVAKREFEAARKAGLDELLNARKAKQTTIEPEQKAPKSEPVTASISGIEVMDIEDAVKSLWKNAIYAESGMGCTGPLIMVSEQNHNKALEVLRREGFVEA